MRSKLFFHNWLIVALALTVAFSACNESGSESEAEAEGEVSETFQCRRDCNSDTDCPATDVAAASAYACVHGICTYVGCRSNAECAHSDQACIVYGDGIGRCAGPCYADNLCDNIISAERDFPECVDGFCVSQGCTQDSDCIAAIEAVRSGSSCKGDPYCGWIYRTRCRRRSGYPFRSCVAGCVIDTDCEVDPEFVAVCYPDGGCGRDRCALNMQSRCDEVNQSCGATLWDANY